MSPSKKTRKKQEASGMMLLQVTCCIEDKQRIKDYVLRLNKEHSKFVDGRVKIVN